MAGHLCRRGAADQAEAAQGKERHDLDRLAVECAAQELQPRTSGSAPRLPPTRLLLASAAVYQDDKEEKMKGVRSLIRYATMCEYMLVPTEEEEVEAAYPEHLPGYGPRGWW